MHARRDTLPVRLPMTCRTSSGFAYGLPMGLPPPKGWKLCKTTKLGQLAVCDKPPVPDVSGFAVRCLSRNTDEFTLWLSLHAELYAETHQDNPVASIDEARYAELFDNGDLHANGIIGGFHGNQLNGISSLRTGPHDRLELGWSGVPNNKAPMETIHLIAKAAALAKSLGHLSIGVEADSTDSTLTVAMSYFQITWQEEYLTFEQPLC